MRLHKYKVNFAIGVSVLVIFFIAISGVSAHTGEENIANVVAEGEALYSKLQSKQTPCADLRDDDFDKIGEFFMGRMMGAGHEAMNAMMEQMMGEAGEKSMHVTMGRRMSGCETDAGAGNGMMGSAGGVGQMIGMMPMMASMMGGGMIGSGIMGYPQNIAGTALGLSSPAYASSFVALWYVIGVLLVTLLVMLILKLGKGLFK